MHVVNGGDWRGDLREYWWLINRVIGIPQRVGDLGVFVYIFEQREGSRNTLCNLREKIAVISAQILEFTIAGGWLAGEITN